MSTIDQDLRSFLLAQSLIADGVGGERIHKLTAPQEETDEPYVVYMVSGHQHERSIDQGVGEEPFHTFFDVEIYGSDLTDAGKVAQLIRDLDGSVGAFGQGTMQALFVEDHSDDYVPKANDSDDIEMFAALQIEILGYKAAL